MIYYNFVGNKSGLNQGVTIAYDELAGTISALLTNGGTPPVSFDAHYPNFTSGDTLIRKWAAGFTYTLKWADLYPFATFTKVAVAVDPGFNDVRINSITVTDETGAGLNNGTAVINATGGSAPYEYSPNAIDWQDSNLFGSLSPQVYTAFVRSKSLAGLIASGNFEVEPFEPTPPEPEPRVKEIIALSGAEMPIQDAYKRVEVLTKFGNVPSLLYNGDFELFDGQNFNFWTRFGGLNFSRVPRTVTNAKGELVPLDNYAIQLNERANAGKYYQSAPIPIQVGDKISVKYRVGKTDTGVTTTVDDGGYSGGYTVTQTVGTMYVCKIRIKVGNYYLRNVDYGTSYEWVTSLSTVSNLIENSKGDANTFSFNFSAPECPVSGLMSLQIYGFTKVNYDKAVSSGGNALNRPELMITELPGYIPIIMDDISVSKTSAVADSDVTGILSSSTNLGFYTEKPDRIEIPFGDYAQRTAADTPLNSLYAIRYNGVYTSGWYEYGTTAAPVPFSLALAKSILRAYQKAFRFWLGDLKLRTGASGVSYLNTFSFEVPGQSLSFNQKVFGIMGGDIDLKYNTFSNGKLTELFDRAGKSVDLTTPEYPGSEQSEIIQDPTVDLNPKYGIFTEEFTQEFT